MKYITLLFLFTLGTFVSAQAQPPLNIPYVTNNLIATVQKLQAIAKDATVSPNAAKAISLPGAESFHGIFPTYYLKGRKRMAAHTWSTTISGGEGRIEELKQLYNATHAEMNKAFPGTYNPTYFEWMIDSTFSVQIILNEKGRDVVSMLANIYRPAPHNDRHVADSIRNVFYQNLLVANGNFDGQVQMAGILYWNLKNLAILPEIVEETYYTAAKEKAANDPQLAYVMLRKFPDLVPAQQIWRALTPQTTAIVQQYVKKDEAAILAANAKKAAEQQAAQKTATASATPTSTVPVVPGTTYTLSKMVIYKTSPSKNYVVATNGAVIPCLSMYQRDIRKGDYVFVNNSLKAVSNVFDTYLTFSDNTSMQRTDWTVSVIRGVGIKSNVEKLNCTVCNNRPVTTGSAPVTAVTGYKTHTYNTSGRTANVISTPTTTQVGSVATTTYCKACNGKAGQYVDKTKVELLD